jgi:hypothetical protein
MGRISVGCLGAHNARRAARPVTRARWASRAPRVQSSSGSTLRRQLRSSEHHTPGGKWLPESVGYRTRLSYSDMLFEGGRGRGWSRPRVAACSRKGQELANELQAYSV